MPYPQHSYELTLLRAYTPTLYYYRMVSLGRLVTEAKTVAPTETQTRSIACNGLMCHNLFLRQNTDSTQYKETQILISQA